MLLDDIKAEIEKLTIHQQSQLWKWFKVNRRSIVRIPAENKVIHEDYPFGMKIECEPQSYEEYRILEVIRHTPTRVVFLYRTKRPGYNEHTYTNSIAIKLLRAG